MDNLGDYIYLILLVLAGLTSLIGKRKKAASDKQRPVVSSEKSWEERMRDLSRGVSVNSEPEEPENTAVWEEMEEDVQPETVEIPVVTAVSPNESPLQPTQIHIAPTTYAPKSVVEKEGFQTDDEWTMASVEDARRAFVYSEIFNRKY